MKIKILSWTQKKEYQKQLLELYDPDKKRTRQYIKWFNNSNFIIIAISDNKIIWAVRIISDMFMAALIIDLLVNPEFRSKWVWKNLMKKTIKLCLDKNIINIELIADPKVKRLPEFYSKLWFCEYNWTYMSLNKNLIK